MVTVYSTLLKFDLEAHFSLPYHQICDELQAPALWGYNCSLANVCAPAGTKFDGSSSGSGDDGSTGGGRDVSEHGDDDADDMPDLGSLEVSFDDDEDDDDSMDEGQDDSMRYSSEALSEEDSQNSQYHPPSIPELDNGEGQAAKTLEIEVQVMNHQLQTAILTSIRMNQSAGASPALEYSLSRNTHCLVLKQPSIKCTVEDDGGTDLRHFNKLKRWVPDLDVPRAVVCEYKSTQRNVAPQHLSEVLKSAQQWFKRLDVKTLADLEKLDEKFLDYCLLSGQGKYIGVMFAHIPKIWFQRHFFADQSLPAAYLSDKGEYITLEYDQPFNHSTPEGRTRASTLKLAVEMYANDFVNLAGQSRAASRDAAPTAVV